MILSREISPKGEASGKPFHPLKTYPARMLRPSADISYRGCIAREPASHTIKMWWSGTLRTHLRNEIAQGFPPKGHYDTFT